MLREILLRYSCHCRITVANGIAYEITVNVDKAEVNTPGVYCHGVKPVFAGGQTQAFYHVGVKRGEIPVDGISERHATVLKR